LQALAGFIISYIIICPLVFLIKKRAMIDNKNKEQEKILTETISENNQELEQRLNEDAIQ